MKPDSAETCALLDRIAGGDADAVNALLERHRGRLCSFVDLHLDAPLRARVDPSDVAQLTELEVAQRMDDFLSRRPMPYRLWLRKTAKERLANLRRDHTRKRRSVFGEEAMPDRSSILLARSLMGRGASPSQEAEAREMVERVRQAMAHLAEQDRDVILLRLGEEMPFDEIGCLLEITAAAARQRFGRALIRLQGILE